MITTIKSWMMRLLPIILIGCYVYYGSSAVNTVSTSTSTYYDSFMQCLHLYQIYQFITSITHSFVHMRQQNHVQMHQLGLNPQTDQPLAYLSHTAVNNNGIAEHNDDTVPDSLNQPEQATHNHVDGQNKDNTINYAQWIGYGLFFLIGIVCGGGL